MSRKITVTIEYFADDLEDGPNPEITAKGELDAWVTQGVALSDIVACGDYKVAVAIETDVVEVTG
jgi:hypothetical protein